MEIKTYDYPLIFMEKIKYKKNADIFPTIETKDPYNKIFINRLFNKFPFLNIISIPNKYLSKYPNYTKYLQETNYNTVDTENNIYTTHYFHYKKILSTITYNPNDTIQIYSHSISWPIILLELGYKFILSDINDGNDKIATQPLHSIAISQPDTPNFTSTSHIYSYNAEIINKLKEKYGTQLFHHYQAITDYSSKFIKKYIQIHPKSTIIIYQNYKFVNNTSAIFQELNHFIHVIIALNTLELGGTFCFYYYNYSIDYMKQITTLLFKYFEKITPIITGESITNIIYYYKFINMKSRITTEDNEILFQILDKWNNLLNGKENNYSDIYLRTKFNIQDYNPLTETDIFITNILKFEKVYTNVHKYPIEIENIVNRMFLINIKKSNIIKDYITYFDYLTDEIILKFNKDNYNNNITTSVNECLKQNVVVYNEFIKKSKIYTKKVIYNVLNKHSYYISLKYANSNSDDINYTNTGKYNLNRNFHIELIMYNYLSLHYGNIFNNIYNTLYSLNHLLEYNKWNIYLNMIIAKFKLFDIIDKKKSFSTNYEKTKWYPKISTVSTPMMLDLFFGFFDNDNYNYDITTTTYFIDENNCLKKLLENCINILSTVKTGGTAILEIILPLNQGIQLDIIRLLKMHFSKLYFIKFTDDNPLKFTIFVIAKNKNKHLDNILHNHLLDKLHNFDQYNAILNEPSYNFDDINKKFTKNVIDKLIKTIFMVDNIEIFNKYENNIINNKLSYFKNDKFIAYD